VRRCTRKPLAQRIAEVLHTLAAPRKSTRQRTITADRPADLWIAPRGVGEPDSVPPRFSGPSVRVCTGVAGRRRMAGGMGTDGNADRHPRRGWQSHSESNERSTQIPRAKLSLPHCTTVSGAQAG
jgi:hypothetical protein